MERYNLSLKTLTPAIVHTTDRPPAAEQLTLHTTVST
jgi:hypothetical protein